MANKKSFKKVCDDFCQDIAEVKKFIYSMKALYANRAIGKKHYSLIHELGIIHAYSAFESFVLELLVAAINRDATSTISKVTGVPFPKHLNDEVCRYLIVGNGYFNFRDRSGLIQILKKFLSEDHFLVKLIKSHKYKPAIEQMIALRNFSAHNKSHVAKRKARKTLNQKRLQSAGAWLKSSNRFDKLLDSLCKLAQEIENHAP